MADDQSYIKDFKGAENSFYQATPDVDAFPLGQSAFGRYTSDQVNNLFNQAYPAPPAQSPPPASGATTAPAPTGSGTGSGGTAQGGPVPPPGGVYVDTSGFGGGISYLGPPPSNWGGGVTYGAPVAAGTPNSSPQYANPQNPTQVTGYTSPFQQFP